MSLFRGVCVGGKEVDDGSDLAFGPLKFFFDCCCWVAIDAAVIVVVVVVDVALAGPTDISICCCSPTLLVSSAAGCIIIIFVALDRPLEALGVGRAFTSRNNDVILDNFVPR